MLAAAQRYLESSFFFVCSSTLPWHRLQSSKVQTCFTQSSQPGRHFLCLGMPVFSCLPFWKETLVTFAEGTPAKAAPGTHDSDLLANINIIATTIKKKKRGGHPYTAVASGFSTLALCCSPLQRAKLPAEARDLKGRANRCSLSWCRAQDTEWEGRESNVMQELCTEGGIWKGWRRSNNQNCCAKISERANNSGKWSHLKNNFMLLELALGSLKEQRKHSGDTVAVGVTEHWHRLPEEFAESPDSVSLFQGSHSFANMVYLS